MSKRVIFEAADPRQGMTVAEMSEALVNAAEIVRVETSMRGKVKRIEVIEK